MVSRRAPLGLFLIAPVVAGLGVYAFTGQAAVDPAPGSETPTASASPTATATKDVFAEETAAAESIYATATAEFLLQPTPVPVVTERGPFHEGAMVRVNAGAGDCLNARWSPGVTAEYTGVNVCLPDGYEGMLTGPASEAEGRWWWYMAGAGYVAEEFITYIRDADLSQAMAPQFASQPGLIAFIRQDGAIWVMRPDGSEQRQVLSPRQEDGYNLWPNNLSWSPDGTMLSFTISRWFSDGRPPTSDLAIINLDGQLVQAFPFTAGRSWSPDGTRMAVVTGAIPGEMGGGWKGVPGIIDIRDGNVVALPMPSAHPNFGFHDLPSFNFDGSLVLMSYGWYDSEKAFERGFVIVDSAGNEVQRILMPAQEYINAPEWSPTANRIAMEHTVATETGSAQTYRVWDLVTASFIASAPVPAYSPNRGGGCGGGADMYRTSWSRDGARIHFGWMFGDAGTNGIWTQDVASGATSLLPVANTYNATSGSGSLVTFSDGQHVFIGDTSGGYPVLITGGHSPVWSPGQ